MIFQSQRSETAVSPSLATYAFRWTPAPKPNDTACRPAFNTQTRRTPKRHRLDTDVDGESSSHLQIKKRKLRRDLITSRLSKPFATPTTYIGSRGRIKPILWPRVRGPTRSNMRKAAIMNWTRQRASTKVEYIRTGQNFNENRLEERNRGESEANSEGTQGISRDVPSEPFKPLDLSDYDALDLEDNLYADDSWVDCEDQMMGSDFGQCDSLDEPFE